MWEDLTLSQKAEIMKMSVAGGVTDIDSIRRLYNDSIIDNSNEGNMGMSGSSATLNNPIRPTEHRFDKGGRSYQKWLDAILQHKGIDLRNDYTYDAAGYYNNNPDAAWDMLKQDSNVHFPDEYKTVNHPTFSTYSNYSGKHSIFNPMGLTGGEWLNKHTYKLSKDQYHGPVSVDETFSYLLENENNGVQILDSNGKFPTLEDGSIWGPILPNINVVRQKALGGHLFNTGGVKQSYNPVSMIESFEGFRASPYRDGDSWSVGYGQYKKGYGANLDWDALLSGRKKLSREEAHQQVINTTNDLNRQLKKALGEKLYNSLTPGQLTAYLDTGYQRPASMIAAARAHVTKGPEAAASMLKVNYPGAWQQKRNAARMAAFVGNDDAFNQLMSGATGYVSSGTSGGMSSGYSYSPSSSQASQQIVLENDGQQVNNWLQYLNTQIKPITFNTLAKQAPQQSRNKLPEFISTDFGNLQSGQTSNEIASTNPITAKRIIESGLGLENNALWNSPYLLFDNDGYYGALGGHLFDTGSELLRRYEWLPLEPSDVEYWNSTHTERVNPGTNVWTDMRTGRPASFKDETVRGDWNQMMGKDFWGKELDNLEIVYNKKDKTKKTDVVPSSPNAFDSYLQSRMNAPIATNEQLESMWRERELSAVDREIQKEQQRRANKQFSNQVDNFFTFQWMRPDQWVGAIERAINPEYFTGRKSESKFDDFWNNWLLGNAGVLTDSYSQEHPYISGLTNFAVDFLGPKVVRGASNLVNKGYNNIMGINNAARWNPNVLNTYRSGLMRPASWFGRVATNPASREFVGSMLAGEAFNLGAKAIGYDSFGDAASKTFGGNPTLWEFANPGYTMYNGEAAKGLFYDLPKGIMEYAYNGLKNNLYKLNEQVPLQELSTTFNLNNLNEIKDTLKGMYNYYKNNINSIIKHPNVTFHNFKNKPRTTTLKEFVDETNLPPMTLEGDWAGDPIALQLNRLQNGGQERLQKIYDDSLKQYKDSKEAINKLKDKRTEDLGKVKSEVFSEYGITNDSEFMSMDYVERMKILDAMHDRENAIIEKYWEDVDKLDRHYAPVWMPQLRYIVPGAERVKNYTVNFKRNTTLGDELWPHTYTNVEEIPSGDMMMSEPEINMPTSMLRKSAQFTKKTVLGHEFEHDVVPFIPGNPEKMEATIKEWLNLDNMRGPIKDYFLEGNGVELSARGSQIKNWFGLREGQPLTGDMIRKAMKDYVRTIKKRKMLDNNMTDLFTNITDPDKAAEWFNKYALGISGIGAVTLGTVASDDEKSSKNN